jgi:hypothetical protein
MELYSQYLYKCHRLFYHLQFHLLKELLKKTTKEDVIEDFKFKLANTYMLMYDRTNYYLEKAKELYKDIINDYPQGIYAKDAKIYIDEILMRQGFLSPPVVAAKYQDSESMQQKALLQELINDKNDKKYELIFRAEKVYNKISNEIVKDLDMKVLVKFMMK